MAGMADVLAKTTGKSTGVSSVRKYNVQWLYYV